MRGSKGSGTGSLPAKATITALRSSGSSTGGLLSAATWSTQTLATYTLSGSTSSFTMTSSKGSCGISGGALSCGSGVTSSTFSAVWHYYMEHHGLRILIHIITRSLLEGIYFLRFKAPPLSLVMQSPAVQSRRLSLQAAAIRKHLL